MLTITVANPDNMGKLFPALRERLPLPACRQACTVTAYRLKNLDSDRMLRRAALTKLYLRAVSG